MRCPSCGTENAPDSRFCGGCGARLGTPSIPPAESRVAPTHKISDDARYPEFQSAPPRTSTPAPVHVPMSVPPIVPYSGQSISRAQTDPSDLQIKRPPAPAPQGSEPSVSLPVPGRRWGLIIAILVIDLGLATTGAVLLSQGLRDDSTATAPTPKPPPAKTSAVDEPAKPAVAKPAPPPPTPPPPPPKIVIAKAVVTKQARPAPPAKPIKGKPARAPVDPYQGDDSAAISDAIEAKSTQADASFTRCYTTATKALPVDQPIKGRIQIAFEVMTDGRVGRVTTAENQTGSDALASCLGTEIAGWVFAQHPEDPMDITKIFAFGPQS